jgi:hypothetical protein
LKLDLPRFLEIVEGIDANYIEMVRCSDRVDTWYYAILGVLKQFIHSQISGGNSSAQDVLSTSLETLAAVVQMPATQVPLIRGFSRAPNS